MITKFLKELAEALRFLGGKSKAVAFLFFAALALFCGQAKAQNGQTPAALPYGATIVPVATNLYGPAPTNCILPGSSGAGAGFTNNFPCSYVYTNVYSNIYSFPVTFTTNIVTNVITGFIDTGKLEDIALQLGFSCTNTTDVSNVVVKLFPSLDGVNMDTTNATFWWTNTSPGSNTLIVTTNFGTAMKGGIAGFFVSQIINYNTNYLFPALTNTTGSNYQFLQVRGRKSFSSAL